MGKRSFKKNKKSKPDFLKSEPALKINYDEKPPVFSFEKMQSNTGYSVECCKSVDRCSLLKRIYMLSKVEWRVIRNASRKGLGVEKIDKSAIKPPIPPYMTEDHEYFHALHYSGNKRFLGYKTQQVFYVLWIDHNFTVYDHG